MANRKRAPGEGSVHLRKDGRWEASRTVGRTAGGNPRRLRTYGRTKGEAMRKLEARIVEAGGIAGALPPNPAALTVRSWVDQWLKLKAGQGLKAVTLSSYRWILDTYALPTIGAHPLNRLRPAHVQMLLAELGTRVVTLGRDLDELREAAGGKPLPTLAPRVLRYVWTLLHGALRQAVRLQLIRTNPCDAVEPPRGRKDQSVKAWTPDELERLLAAAEAHSPRLVALYYLAATTGARRGELLALRWDDVDLVEHQIRIHTTRGANGEETTTKTRAGDRRVTLPLDAVAVLEAHRARQDDARKLATEAGYWQESGHVFTTTVGTPIGARNLLHDLERLAARAGVRRLPFHSFRHTAATLALRAGVLPRTLSERLGHADPSITLRVYCHVVGDMEKAAALPLETLLRGQAKPAETAAEAGKSEVN